MIQLNKLQFGTPYTAQIINQYPNHLEPISLICEYNELINDEYFKLKIDLSKALTNYSIQDFDTLKVSYTSKGKITLKKLTGEALDVFLQQAGLELDNENASNFLYDLNGFHQKYEDAKAILKSLARKSIYVSSQKPKAVKIEVNTIINLPRVFEPILWILDKTFQVLLKNNYKQYSPNTKKISTKLIQF